MQRMPPAAISVLVVDDEEPVRTFVERVLREAGHKTTTARAVSLLLFGRVSSRRFPFLKDARPMPLAAR
jgi:CheY-like chemotaxis protein